MNTKNIVLIVDDNIENLNILSEILEAKDYEVRIANTGKDAIKSISISLPDLILLDINMPVMSGFELCLELKKQSATQALPIIFLSALTEVTDIVKAFEIGGLDYITKPFIPEIVLARVKTHIDLYKIKQNLKNLVDERTTQLRKANEELLSASENLKENYIELEEAKEKIEERELRIRSISDNLVNGMIYQIVMPDEKTRKFTYLSDTVKKFYGCTVDGAKADSSLIYSRVHKDDIKRMLDLELEALHKMSEFRAEVRMTNPDGSTRWSYFVSSPHNNKDIVTWNGLEIDITEQKKVEQELIKAKAKSEESERLKTAFLQNMSHEIRTPMNAIIGFSSMLNKPDLPDEKRKSFANIIMNNSNQLLSIVSDILTISTIETKQEKLNVQKVCINHIIVDLLAVFKSQASGQNISLYAKQALPDKQAETYTDITKVTQVITNLLTNAMKFTHNGYIEFGYTIVTKNDESFMQFYVKDTGIGIEVEQKDNIFERFRQADLSINKKYGGTGLGLSISKGFVDLLGGEIWVESVLNQGSTFYFTIPFKPLHSMELANSIKISNNVKTILIAEDEEFNYLFIEELLIDQNIKIIHAKNGQETVDICKKNKNISLILMDIKMPILDGHTAALRIREFNPGVPIIAQSAYALEHEIEKYSGIAFNDYITKPIEENEFLDKVMKYLQ